MRVPRGTFVALFFFGVFLLSVLGLYRAANPVSSAAPNRQPKRQEHMKIRSPFGAVITQQNIDLVAEQAAFLAHEEPNLVQAALTHFRKRTDCEATVQVDTAPLSLSKQDYDWVGSGRYKTHYAVVRAKDCA